MRPAELDPLALAVRGHAMVHGVGPVFLDAFAFRSTAAAGAVLKAIEVLRRFYAGGRRSFPKRAPIAFFRRSWRSTVLVGGPDGRIDKRAYELCVLAELRDRLRAGDVWIEGGHRYRAIEDQLIPRPVFTAMREVGPLPVALPCDPDEYLAERAATLRRRMDEVAAAATAGHLEGVRVGAGGLRVAPLKAATPEEAEALAERLYALVPSVRITELLGLGRRLDRPGRLLHPPARRAGRPRTRAWCSPPCWPLLSNLGLTRMAEACSLATRRPLTWIAGWHLREET